MITKIFRVKFKYPEKLELRISLSVADKSLFATKFRCIYSETRLRFKQDQIQNGFSSSQNHSNLISVDVDTGRKSRWYACPPIFDSNLISKLRLITAFLLPKQMTTIRYECLPSYSSMQFAHIANLDESIIVPSFSMFKGYDFDKNSCTYLFECTRSCLHGQTSSIYLAVHILIFLVVRRRIIVRIRPCLPQDDADSQLCA